MSYTIAIGLTHGICIVYACSFPSRDPAGAHAMQVYDTLTHSQIRTILRPAGGAHASSSQVSLLFGQNERLYIGWPDCIKVIEPPSSLGAVRELGVGAARCQAFGAAVMQQGLELELMHFC